MDFSEARIADIEEVAAGCFSLVLEQRGIAEEASPGQFIFIRINNSLTPFLRRPFSIAGVWPETGLLQIFFSLRGEGTEILSRKRRGDILDSFGPMGTGFSPGDDPSLTVLLGGGIGMAPLLFLARNLQERQKKIVLFYGASQSDQLIPLQRFLSSDIEINLATDDGSSGFKGFVTDLFQSRLQDGMQPEEIFACGPRQMMQNLMNMEIANSIKMQFSMEERMACGIGACRGCVVEIRSSTDEKVYKRVCRDGPVFNSSEVVW